MINTSFQQVQYAVPGVYTDGPHVDFATAAAEVDEHVDYADAYFVDSKYLQCRLYGGIAVAVCENSVWTVCAYDKNYKTVNVIQTSRGEIKIEKYIVEWLIPRLRKMKVDEAILGDTPSRDGALPTS